MDAWKHRFSGTGILLVSVISAAIGLQVSILHSIYEVARGDAVNITCNFQPKNPVNRLIVISWTGEPDGSFDDEGISFGTFYSNDNHVDISAMYDSKAQIDSNVNEKVSKLFLKYATLRESRRIKCLVQIPGDTEGQTSASTSLVVLVAPSDPVCKIKGTAEYGQNISLTCVSEEGSPAPTYQWQSYDVKNIPRSMPPKAIEKDGVLSLFNVSIDTSGYYICTSANKVRSTQCNLTLSVLPPSMNIGTTAGIIGGCVAAIAVLVLIIYCCCKDKQHPEEFVMEPPVIEYHDSSNQEKQDDGSGNVRKTSTAGLIDQREKYETQSVKDTDRHSNEQFDYNKHEEDEPHEKYDDRRNIYTRGHNEGRREPYNDHNNYYTDRQKHGDDRRSQYDDLNDQYDDRHNRDNVNYQHNRSANHYHNPEDRLDNHRDRYNNRQEHYRDRRDRYDNPQERGRFHYSDEERNHFPPSHDYDEPQVRHDRHYGDHQNLSSEHSDRYKQQGP